MILALRQIEYAQYNTTRMIFNMMSNPVGF